MDKLEANDIRDMLEKAAEGLVRETDREIVSRLSAALQATDRSDWDLKLVATLLAKAGMFDDAERLIGCIERRWERADAYCSVGRAMWQMDDTKQSDHWFEVAIKESEAAQAEGNEQDVNSAAAVLADIAELYAEHGQFDRSEKVIAAIVHPIRQQRAYERLRELRGPTEEEVADDSEPT